MNDLAERARSFADRRWTWLVSAVVALGGVVRFWGLGSESLWNDELSSVVFTRNGAAQAIVKAMADTGPPLYYVLQSWVNGAVGVSEWGMRLLPAAFGTLSVLVVYLVGRRMLGRGVGLGAAFVLALSRLPLFYSQEARAYSLAMLTVLLVALTLLRAAEKPSAGRLALHALALAAAAYTHLFALVAAGGIVLGVLVRPQLLRRLSWRWGVALAAAALAYAPWAFVLLRQVGKVSAANSSGEWVLNRPGNLLVALYQNLGAYAPWGQGHLAVRLGFLALLALGVVASLTERGEPGAAADTDAAFAPRAADGRMSAIGGAEQLALLLGWTGAVFVGGLVVSKYALPIFDLRMALVAAPALYLLAANGIAWLGRRWWPVVPVAVLVFALFAGVGLYRYHTQPQKEQLREAVTYLLEQDAQREVVFAYTHFMAKNIDEYAKILGDSDGITAERLGRMTSQSQLDSQVSSATTGATVAYLVIGHAPFVRGTTTAADLALEAAGFSATDSRELRGVIVRRYERSTAQSVTPEP